MLGAGQSGKGVWFDPGLWRHTEQEWRTWLWREAVWLSVSMELSSMGTHELCRVGEPPILFSLCLQQHPCVLAATWMRNWTWPLYVGGSPGVVDIFVNGIATFISKANC